MGNQVTIRIDSRAAYGLIAILAVLGIFVLGWWLGTAFNRPKQTTATNPAAATQAPGSVAVSQPTVQVSVATPVGGANPAGKGVSPVAAEDVPVGDGQARLWIDELNKGNNFIFDMGEMAATTATERSFTVKNIGKAELVIDKISASCGCTTAVVGKNNLAPGESTTVRVTYDPNVNGDQGKFIQKTIRIMSNDPVAPVVEFSIEGDVLSQ
jgi:hypothetical protein